ncbi:hypothetical protein ADL35_04155 [Streptomyces sp. NRRL WC-3753]|nr:hypothetical protein ADL35_04155 [Streptomyces sp. NRRL WC-3753]
MAWFIAVCARAASARTASLVVSPVFHDSKTSLTPFGRVMSGRLTESDADALGGVAEGGFPVSAPSILSLPPDLPSPLPQAVRSSAAVAASTVATGKEWRFTVDSP